MSFFPRQLTIYIYIYIYIFQHSPISTGHNRFNFVFTQNLTMRSRVMVRFRDTGTINENKKSDFFSHLGSYRVKFYKNGGC